MRTRHVLGLFGIVATAMLLAACSSTAAPAGSAVQKPTAAAESTPVATSAPVPATEASGTKLSAAEAWTIVQAKCTVCHTLDRVTKAKLDWKGWNAAVDHMVKNGSKLTPEERTAIVDYLASRK
jgi:hypothetical protein